jgi:hypothetical protein
VGCPGHGDYSVFKVNAQGKSRDRSASSLIYGSSIATGATKLRYETISCDDVRDCAESDQLIPSGSEESLEDHTFIAVMLTALFEVTIPTK